MRLPAGESVRNVPAETLSIEATTIDKQHQVHKVLNTRVRPLS